MALLIFFALSLPVLFIHIIYSSEDFRSIKNELLSFAALCMTAPLAYYAATDELTTRTFSLWILCYLYYAGSVFYVKMNVAARMKKNDVTTLKGKFSIARDALFYHSAALIAAFFLSAISLAPRLSCLALIPSLWKVFARALNLNEPVPIKKLGWLEVAYALLFTFLLILSFRVS